MNYLRPNAHTVSDALYRAFHNSVDVEFAADVGSLPACALVRSDRSAGNDPQARDSGQFGDYFIGKAVRKVFLRRIGRQINQRQGLRSIESACAKNPLSDACR